MKLRPLAGQSLIEILPPSKLSDGGIAIPDYEMTPEDHQKAARTPKPPPPHTGIVRAIGSWPKNKRGMAVMPEFGIGSKVILRHNAGLPMDYGATGKFRMILNEEVLAVLS